jgi:hypothetical protein
MVSLKFYVLFFHYSKVSKNIIFLKKQMPFERAVYMMDSEMCLQNFFTIKVGCVLRSWASEIRSNTVFILLSVTFCVGSEGKNNDSYTTHCSVVDKVSAEHSVRVQNNKFHWMIIKERNLLR